MDFFLVDVKSITPSVPFEQVDKTQVEKLADSILECNGLLKPLVLKPTGPESYAVINGNKEYYAALQAIEPDENANRLEIKEILGSFSTQLTLMRQEIERLTQREDKTYNKLANLEGEISEITKKRNNDADIQNEPENYNNLTVPKLKVLAKERNIKGRSYMKKAQLIDALKKSDMA